MDYHQSILGGIGVCMEPEVVMSDLMKKQKCSNKNNHLNDGNHSSLQLALLGIQ